MRILVIDDDGELVDLLCLHLERDGHSTAGATSGAEGLRLAKEMQPQLVLLDVVLPDLDGRTVCRLLREEHSIPIVFLSVKGQEDDIIHGLHVGADDYIPKPFSMAELSARIRAIARRLVEDSDRTYSNGMLYIDPATCMACRGKEWIELTPIESKLIGLLLKNQGQAVRRDELIASLWARSARNGYSYLAACVRQLRRKLEPEPHKPIYIRTVRGVGYRFAPLSEV